MIYTVTFNPSLDYIVSVKEFALGRTNRTSSEQLVPGGKGLNVSMMLKNLGIDSTALGFTAGFVGKEIIRRIKELGIENGFVEMEQGISRINVKLKDIEGTEINGMGPAVSEQELADMMKRLETLQAGDVLVLAGSIPAGMPRDLYSRICGKLKNKGVCLVVDAEKTLLESVLPEHPFLVKPNHHELGELFGVEINTREEAARYACKLQEKGAQNVLVSMAGQGAVLADKDGWVYESEAPKGVLVNGVGAGDSMVAGFLAGWLETGEYEEAFAMGIACGSASAFSEHLAQKKEVTEVYRQIHIIKKALS